MPKSAGNKKQGPPDLDILESNDAQFDQERDDELVPEGSLVCALTGELKPATEQEETLQSFLEQLHREYGFALEDMDRGVKVQCQSTDSSGKTKSNKRTCTLAIYAAGQEHSISNITRVVIIAGRGTKATQKAIGILEDILGNLSTERDQVFGLWSNGIELAFRLRDFHPRTGEPRYIELTDIPGEDETLADLESAERRPLRVAVGDSLLRTFKRCHDYLYGNQNMRGDRAFWQLLYLIFSKILDERGTARNFFVGATERNTPAGQAAISRRITDIFDKVKRDYADVFDGSERLELNDRALSYIAAELSRYNLLSTDTDAKGTAYEAITSTTLKREKGQFFTPRNVIRMMVDMLDPQPKKKILDPACGSGGFLVVALAKMRRRFLAETGCQYPDFPLPSELKRVEAATRAYARECLFGVDVDMELRKAARMNMVMNNDGHGNILSFNALEFGIPKYENEQTAQLKSLTGGHGAFDYVFTNPPFGAKIPVEDPEILDQFDLGYSWKRVGEAWVKGSLLKRVPPEILFIEACFKFLKPATGVMALVLPDGILGNPGEQMEFVRYWMLRHMELLASVDLPAEAFLPQVSVQASCVFLRRRAPSELQMLGKTGPRQGPVFMAVAEHCGHGRRGETRWVREPDGSELLEVQSIIERSEKNGVTTNRPRQCQVRRLADDLPWIAAQYRHPTDSIS